MTEHANSHNCGEAQVLRMHSAKTTSADDDETPLISSRKPWFQQLSVQALREPCATGTTGVWLLDRLVAEKKTLHALHHTSLTHVPGTATGS